MFSRGDITVESRAGFGSVFVVWLAALPLGRMFDRSPSFHPVPKTGALMQDSGLS